MEFTILQKKIQAMDMVMAREDASQKIERSEAAEDYRWTARRTSKRKTVKENTRRTEYRRLNNIIVDTPIIMDSEIYDKKYIT